MPLYWLAATAMIATVVFYILRGATQARRSGQTKA
jgi:hypothetical protein